MPKAKRSPAEHAALLLAIGEAVLAAVSDSGLLVRPKATRKTKGPKRKRRTKAEMQAARATHAKPAKAKKPKLVVPEAASHDDIEDDD